MLRLLNNNPQWPVHAFRFGGGRGTTQIIQQPISSAPIAKPAPPVTTTSAEVMQAQSDLRRQSLKKRGFSSTIFAGDTGGWFGGNMTPSPTNPKAKTAVGMGSGATTLGS